MKKISKKELEENYWARIESESYHELTPEQIKRSEEIEKKFKSMEENYMAKIG